ncbi:MAG: flavodoxin domain-containing protein [Xanthomonadales bacterium]|nr:flavodoxin domain-containing protein [Xanthomonadales bacterium]
MAGKTAVAFYTKGGATEGYAQMIAETLSAAGFDVDLINLRKNRNPDLSPYPNIVLGTGVRIGLVYRIGKRFLRRNDFSRKNLAIFLSSGIAIEDAEKSKDKFLVPLIQKYHLDPILFDALPGQMPDDKNVTVEPEKARDWARKLAALLQARS